MCEKFKMTTTYNLKTGLARMIAEVEKLPEETIFNMSSYRNCVIGKTVKWDVKHGNELAGRKMYQSSLRTLTRLFGIKPPSLISFEHHKPFDSRGHEVYREKTWEVIRLFTGAIGYNMSREEWLNLAKSQLAKM